MKTLKQFINESDRKTFLNAHKNLEHYGWRVDHYEGHENSPDYRTEYTHREHKDKTLVIHGWNKVHKWSMEHKGESLSKGKTALSMHQYLSANFHQKRDQTNEDLLEIKMPKHVEHISNTLYNQAHKTVSDKPKWSNRDFDHQHTWEVDNEYKKLVNAHLKSNPEHKKYLTNEGKKISKGGKTLKDKTMSGLLDSKKDSDLVKIAAKLPGHTWNNIDKILKGK